MHFEGNIFYHVMPSCITFYLAVSGFSFSNIQVEADLEFCQIQGLKCVLLFSALPLVWLLQTFKKCLIKSFSYEALVL